MALAVVDDDRANSRNNNDVEIILLIEEGVPLLLMTIKVDAGNNGNVENHPPLPSPSSSSMSSSSSSSMGDGPRSLATLWRDSVKFSKDFSDGAILEVIFLESRQKLSHLGPRDLPPPRPNLLPRSQFLPDLDQSSGKIYLQLLTNM